MKGVGLGLLVCKGIVGGRMERILGIMGRGRGKGWFGGGFDRG